MPLHRSRDVTPDSWSTLLADSPTAVLYKHSPTCGLCDIALEEITAFVETHPDVPVHLIDVLAQRAVSNAVEAQLGVRHESPQAFVFRDGAVTWHGSHRRITAGALASAVTAVTDDPK